MDTIIFAALFTVNIYLRIFVGAMPALHHERSYQFICSLLHAKMYSRYRGVAMCMNNILKRWFGPLGHAYVGISSFSYWGVHFCDHRVGCPLH